MNTITLFIDNFLLNLQNLFNGITLLAFHRDVNVDPKEDSDVMAVKSKKLI